MRNVWLANWTTAQIVWKAKQQAGVNGSKIKTPCAPAKAGVQSGKCQVESSISTRKNTKGFCHVQRGTPCGHNCELNIVRRQALDSISSTFLIIKYLWPVGFVFGFVVLGIQIHHYASIYDPALHGLGEDPSLLTLSWEMISGKYHMGRRPGIPASVFILICVIAGVVIHRIERL